MSENNIQYSSDERIFSSLAHAAIVLPYIGLLAPLAIWITHREKSPWLRFQALQALVYQMLQFVFLLLGSCLIVPVFITAPFFWMDQPEKMFAQMFIVPFLPYLFWGFLILGGLFGGLLCAFGKDFRYPILGNRIKRYLEDRDQLSLEGGKNG